MKKLTLFFIFILVFTLSGCTELTQQDNPQEPDIIDDNKDIIDDNKTLIENYEEYFNCDGSGDFIIVDGVCYKMDQILKDSITYLEELERSSEIGDIKTLNNYVADLTNSTGIAVVSKDVYNNNTNPQTIPQRENGETSEDTENNDNVIVKLTEEGFFEEVSFTDDLGNYVSVMPNPIALEVYGAYTVIFFETDSTYFDPNDPNIEFADLLYNSLYTGGAYLLHNETGKMFSTKDTVINQEIREYTVDNYRDITLTVTLNEPAVEVIYKEVLDEFGEPVLDDEGNPIYEEILNELIGDDGNPIIFTDGPYLTEIIDVPQFEYYEVKELDEEGNPILDEEGNPIITIEEVPILDELGEQLYLQEETIVFDDEGNPVFQNEFEVTIQIKEVQHIMETINHISITDNALSELGQIFIQKILEEYYNYSYYRVYNHQLYPYNFVFDDENIFFRHDKIVDNKNEQIVTKIDFDYETNELLLEEFVNLSKAGLAEGEVIYDTNSKLIISKMWEGDIKIYSETNGLRTIPDSSNMQFIQMPNGEILLNGHQEKFVEELGYYTLPLYAINSDGTLSERYFEIGEKFELSYGNHNDYVNYYLLDEEGNPYDYQFGLSLLYNEGDKIHSSFNLQVSETGEFSSLRTVCEQSWGCNYSVEFTVLDSDGLEIGSGMDSRYVDEGNDAFPSKITYQLTEDSNINYRRIHTNTEEVCSLEIGCVQNFSIYDQALNQYGLHINYKSIIEQGDKIINGITIPEDAPTTREYSQEINRGVCENEYCSVLVMVELYNSDDQLIDTQEQWMGYSLGDVMPFVTEVHINDDAVIDYHPINCDQDSCSYQTNIGNYYFDISYGLGETPINYISENDTTITHIYDQIFTAETCTNVDGCYQEYVTYKIVDDNNNILYETTGNVWVDYGYKEAYLITVNINDTTINYSQNYTEEDMICVEETCTEYVNVYQVTSTNQHDHLFNLNVTYQQGDKIIDSIELTNTNVIEEDYQEVCHQMDGCHYQTNNFTIIDEDGNEVGVDDINHQQFVTVIFGYGEPIPVQENIAVTLTMTDAVYRMNRSSVYEFINYFDKMHQIDENLFFIEKDDWTPGDYNFLISFNEETGNYKVVYTNLTGVSDIVKFNESYIAVNDIKTAIYQFTYVDRYSTDDYYYYDLVNLTEGLQINEVEDLFVDYDGSIYFTGIDNFIQDITGFITDTGEVTIDTEYTERQIIRVRSIN